jgi:hypothetical protein
VLGGGQTSFFQKISVAYSDLWTRLIEYLLLVMRQVYFTEFCYCELVYSQNVCLTGGLICDKIILGFRLIVINKVMLMEVPEKLKILAAAAKYDVSCSSSGSKRKNNSKDTGSR